MGSTFKTFAVSLAAAGLALAAAPAAPATYLARTFSRAICVAPIPYVSPDWDIGLVRTFNESISWDPLLWNRHHAMLEGWHLRKTLTPSSDGSWAETLDWLGNFAAGPGDGWRFWAGTVDNGNTAEPQRLPFDGSPYRFVSAHHWEFLDNAKYWS